MALFTDDFTGTAGQKLTARSGWAKIGAGSDSQGAEIGASNAARCAATLDDVPLIGQIKASVDHYVQFTARSNFGHNG